MLYGEGNSYLLNFKILVQALNKESAHNYLNCDSRHCFSSNFPPILQSHNVAIYIKLPLNQQSKKLWIKIENKPKVFTQTSRMNNSQKKRFRDGVSTPCWRQTVGSETEYAVEQMSHLRQQKRCF